MRSPFIQGLMLVMFLAFFVWLGNTIVGPNPTCKPHTTHGAVIHCEVE